MNDILIIHDTSQPIGLSAIPVSDYPLFRERVLMAVADENLHCVSYFACPDEGAFRFICILADDLNQRLLVLGHRDRGPLLSLTADNPAFHVFEREIHESTGILFEGHPWLKPLRYGTDCRRSGNGMEQYPFFRISGDELHEVGVGPVHAGIIEPGHFRFTCHGEKVLHLEMQLGYQHRGIERMMEGNTDGLRHVLLAESIAGDSVIGHASTHAAVIETLSGCRISGTLAVERAVALELERIAMHTGDAAALCADVAYQLGQVVYESLRTIVINSTQLWCGNRFGKGLIRPHGTWFPVKEDLGRQIVRNLDTVMERMQPMGDRLYTLPSVVARFDGTGSVTRSQMLAIGAVGMAARSAGLKRDIRWSHPSLPWKDTTFEPVVLDTGDVMARALLRKMETEQSVSLIRQWIDQLSEQAGKTEHPDYQRPLTPNSLAVHLTEGWRGEICHVAITDKQGKIMCYKIKDPSMHNWIALALAVRAQEISDFPVCNKSFNLSYCGHDL